MHEDDGGDSPIRAHSGGSTGGYEGGTSEERADSGSGFLLCDNPKFPFCTNIIYSIEASPVSMNFRLFRISLCTLGFTFKEISGEWMLMGL